MSLFRSIAASAAQRLKSFADGGGGPYGVGYGYDATLPKGQRKLPLGRVLSEDMELRDLARRQLMTNNRDLQRNFELASWAVRQHLNYTTNFRFRSRTGDPDLDKEIEQRMEWWSKPQNCDLGRRHSLGALIRMWEARAVLDGDIAVNALDTGRVQTIEGDRILTAGGIPADKLGVRMEDLVNGVHVDSQTYESLGYCVFKRRPLWAGLEWDRYIPARFCKLHGFYDRYDQIRGISPLSSACNRFRDIYENFDYALLKAKVSQFFALVTQRQEAESFGAVTQEIPEVGDQRSEVGGDIEVPPGGIFRPPGMSELEARYKLNFGRGPINLDIEPGDKPPMVLESATPSTQFQGFTQQMIVVALLALDIPFCFLDSAHANYSGTTAAANNYETSCETRRAVIRILLDWLTRWRLGLFILDGDLRLPSNLSPGDLRWEWAHAGRPWYDRLKEVTGAVAEVNAGFNSPQRVCRSRGTDFFEIIDERAAAEAYAKGKGVILSTALAVTTMDDPNASRAITEQANEDKDPKEEQQEKEAKAASVARWSV